MQGLSALPKCSAQVRFEPATPQSRVKHSTTELLRALLRDCKSSVHERILFTLTVSAIACKYQLVHFTCSLWCRFIWKPIGTPTFFIATQNNVFLDKKVCHNKIITSGGGGLY